MKNSSDEIDFEPVIFKTFAAIKRFFSSIGSFINWVIANIKMIILFSIIGGIIGLALSYVAKPYFKVSMSITTSYFGKVFLEKSIEDVSLLIEEKNYLILGETFNLTAENAKNIKGIELKPIDEIIYPSDTTLNEFIYYFFFDVYSEDILPDLQNGLITHLENNTFATKKKLESKFILEETIMRTKQSINTLDSIIEKVEKNIGVKNTGSTIILNEPINPSQLINQKNSLSNTLVVFESRLANLKNVLLVKGFNKTFKPYFPKKSSFTLIGMILGFIVGAIFIRVKTKV